MSRAGREKDLETRVAYFLREATPLFSKERAVSFDPVQTTYLQQLVREKVLTHGITIQKEEFFQGILYVDYFCDVLAARLTLLDDLAVIVEELEKMHDYLDIDLELVVRYSALYVVKDLKGEKFFRASKRKQVVRRHEQSDRAVNWRSPGLAQGVDVFHRAAARMVLDAVDSQEVRAYLGSFQSGNDLRGALFLDAVLDVLSEPVARAPALAALKERDVPGAAHAALEALVDACDGWSLKSYVAQKKAALEG